VIDSDLNTLRVVSNTISAEAGQTWRPAASLLMTAVSRRALVQSERERTLADDRSHT
jgi:hypothetical protein